MKFPCTLKNALLIIRDRFGMSFSSKGLGYLAALLLLLSVLARYKLSCYQTTPLLIILALVAITLLKTVIISFCSSLGSTLLLIEKATIDPLYLWVIKTIFWRRCRGALLYSLSHLGFISSGHYEELERRENKILSLIGS